MLRVEHFSGFSFIVSSRYGNVIPSVNYLHLLPNIRQYLGGLLYIACDHGASVGEISDLLMRGANVNWMNNQGWTALHWASFGRPDIMKVLLRASPNINQQNIDGCTPLHYACKYGHIDCIKLLLITGQCDTG